MARRLAPGFRIGQSFQARFDHQAAHLVTLGKRITLWSVAERARVAKGPPLQNASSIDFAPGGRKVVAKNTRGDLLVLGVPALDEKARFSGDRFGEGSDIRFAPDGRHLIDGSWTGLLTVRDAATGDLVWQEPGHDIFEVDCMRDRRMWAYTRAPKREPGGILIRAWPFADNASAVVPNVPSASALAISHDGLRLPVAGRGLTVQERTSTTDDDWRTTARIDTLPSGGTGDALAWSPDGSLLAHTGARRAVIFDPPLSELHREQLHHVSPAQFAPAGDLIAFGVWGWPPAGA